MKKVKTTKERLMTQYDYVWEEQHGTYKVVQNDKYGYFDTEGKQIVPFMYDWASCFTPIKLYGKKFIGTYVQYTMERKKTKYPFRRNRKGIYRGGR